VPYIDYNTDNVDISGSDYDITIIGAGAAGILLALKLSEKGMKVLLVESGHFNEDDKRQVLNEVTQTGKHLSSSVWGRKRAVGGTTIAWGGQSLPFSEFDFEQKDWVNASGWPLPYSEVNQYYNDANTFMGIDTMDYGTDIFKHLNHTKPEFDENEISYHFSKWAPQPDFRRMYDERLRSDVTILYNAVLTKVGINNSKVESIVIQNYNSGSLNISVNILILATGTIEAVRTLLLNGIGNQSDLLGKYFMEHPCINAGEVKAPDQYLLQKQFNTHIRNNRKYSIRLSLATDVQKKLKLLNASGGIMFYYPDDIMDPYVEVRKAIRQKNMGSAMGIVSNFNAYFLSAKAYFLHRLIYKHKARGKLVLMLEQEPLEQSTISLSTETDQFGLRKANINWSVSRKTWDAAIHLSEKIRDEFTRLSLGEVQLHDYLFTENKDWADYLTDVNHHMGGTRMSDTPQHGVVDTDLKVWGCDNLYVCSCSVFPTASHSNPTLTMLALALRLTEKLAKK
jgi:choline dehydrogenase-like flavoprotein